MNTDIQKEWEYWYPRVYGYFYKRIDNQYYMEELTAQALSTAFLAENVNNFQAYLWKVSHNYLVKYINFKTTEPMTVGLDENIDGFSSEDKYFKLDQNIENSRTQKYQENIQKTLDCINHHLKNQQDKQILEMSIIQEKNSTQIADLLNLKAPTVRQRLSRLVKKIKIKCIYLWQ